MFNRSHNKQMNLAFPASFNTVRIITVYAWPLTGLPHEAAASLCFQKGTEEAIEIAHVRWQKTLPPFCRTTDAAVCLVLRFT